MRVFRRLFAAVIITALFASLIAGSQAALFAEGESELSLPDQKFMRQVSPYAEAVALTLFGRDSIDYLHTEEGMWEAIGWYSVVKGYDYISFYEVKGVQEAFWPNGIFYKAPQDLIDSGKIVAIYRGGSIGMSYSFPVQKMLYSEDRIDATRSAVSEYGGRFTIKTTVSQSFGEYVSSEEITVYVKPWDIKASTVSKIYRSPYVVRGADLPKSRFSFTIEDVQQANNVLNMTKLFGSVKVSDSHCDTDGSGWSTVSYYYSQDGSPATISTTKDAEGNVTYTDGYYKGFYYYTENGHTEAYSYLESKNSYDNDFYTTMFYGDPFYIGSDGDVVTFATLIADYYGVSYDVYRINRKNLLVKDDIRKNYYPEYEYTEDYELIYPDNFSDIEITVSSGESRYEYKVRVDDNKVARAWTEGVKTVTVRIEKFDGGTASVDIYKVRVPKTWEYIPFEFYEYNCWMNEGYTREYKYPGDGVNYTLYLTEAMG